MRAHFLSLLLVLCTLLASQAAPIDSRDLFVSSRKVKAAPKPVKAAPKPAPKPAEACGQAHQGSAEACGQASKPIAKPTKAAPKTKPTKAASKPVAKPAKTPAAAPKASKAATTSKATACPLPTKGSKTGVKARVNSDCDGTSPAELCASFDTCADCVTAGAALQCAFDVKDGKCVPKTTTGLTLATSQKTCTTLLAAQQIKVLRHPVSGRRCASCRSTGYGCCRGRFQQKTSRTTYFRALQPKKNSGRHILSAWTKANPKSAENKRNTATGIVEFQNGADIKTVWNDVNAGNTFVYTQDQIKTLCLRGYQLSILANPSNAATLKAPAQPAASTSKKGKGKATAAPAALKLTSGLNNGFVVHNPFINQNVCINISSASCFPPGTGTASGAEGTSCTRDADVED
ncbi:hypothetical protein K438DRAFT_1938366 [Mycena galopus ATCC 62051]|nr:hypothetical protein K438DRAFT_1938366 [Mycena galopus ATCC 62051]